MGQTQSNQTEGNNSKSSSYSNLDIDIKFKKNDFINVINNIFSNKNYQVTDTDYITNTITAFKNYHKYLTSDKSSNTCNNPSVPNWLIELWQLVPQKYLYNKGFYHEWSLVKEQEITNDLLRHAMKYYNELQVSDHVNDLFSKIRLQKFETDVNRITKMINDRISEKYYQHNYNGHDYPNCIITGLKKLSLFVEQQEEYSNDKLVMVLNELYNEHELEYRVKVTIEYNSNNISYDDYKKYCNPVGIDIRFDLYYNDSIINEDCIIE